MEEKDEITLKDLILKLKEFWAEIWNKKWWVVGAGLLFGLISGVNAYLKPTLYNASLTFMVNDDEGGGGMAGLGAILGQFGLGGGGAGKYNYDKIMEIARSNRILQNVLLDSSTLEEKTDINANHIINIYELHQDWEDDTLLNGFLFTAENVNSLSAQKVLKSLIGKLRGNPEDKSLKKLLNIQYDEESTIMEVTCSSVNETLSINLSNSWYNYLSDFYISKSIERQQSTFQALKQKSDSIYRLLVGSESSLASNTEMLGLVKASDFLPRSRSSRNMQMYATMYAEVIRNKETAEFLLKNETPFFQVIDLPMAPLIKSKNSPIIIFFLFCFIGGIIAVMILLLRSYLRIILA